MYWVFNVSIGITATHSQTPATPPHTNGLHPWSWAASLAKKKTVAAGTILRTGPERSLSLIAWRTGAWAFPPMRCACGLSWGNFDRVADHQPDDRWDEGAVEFSQPTPLQHVG